MSQQSTRHLLMIDPVTFYTNPETMETNVYQVEADNESIEEIFVKARTELRGFRDLLVENGVFVTTVSGAKGCPDAVFPNGISTHAGGKCFLYPMLTPNRRAERKPGVTALMNRLYDNVEDWTHYEKGGLFLEATGSICSDRVNKVAYATLSPRTNPELLKKWADHMGYDLEMFETATHSGKPVYHTDLLLYIGSTMAGFCAEALIDDAARARVLARLQSTHEVVEFTMDQLRSFCGNALEVRGEDDEKILVMSSAAYGALDDDQLAIMNKHFDQLLHSPLPTLEKYGGGSARCCLCELF